MGQSVSFAGAAASVDGADSPEVDADFSAETEPGSLDVARFGLPVPDLSLRAQPLPLKWTAGAAKARLMGPPHCGQVVGPWPWTACMTSIVWPQLAQT
jgi:hypothetical protein